MNSVSVRLRYRPVRLGWCVRDQNLEDLRRALRYSHAFVGCIFNPIIPVDHSESKEFIVAEAPIDQMPIFVKEGSIVPMRPVVQSAVDAADPLEFRIYGGRNADFQLYEDSGDGYAYEKGARATIQLHWDDRRNVLSIGRRAGAFPGMRMKHAIRIILVKPGHGIGAGSDSGVDRSITYDRHPTKINLATKAERVKYAEFCTCFRVFVMKDRRVSAV